MIVVYLPTVVLLAVRLVASDGAGINMDWVVGALVLGFISQTLVGWNRLTKAERDMHAMAEDIRELIGLHPRSGNPGKGRLSHDPTQFCGNAKCIPHNQQDRAT
jgi:hypothetical protein